jgi:hypothetical protein
MWACTALTSIDLGPLAKVTTIGEGFMMDCTALATADIGPLVNLKEVGKNFMKKCPAMKPAKRTQLLKAVADRFNGVILVPPKPDAARKVEVKAGGKRKKM